MPNVANSPANSPADISVVVDEILPRLGVAYLHDDVGRSWGVTRSTPGVGLDRLHCGQRLRLSLKQHGSFTLASGYIPLD